MISWLLRKQQDLLLGRTQGKCRRLRELQRTTEFAKRHMRIACSSRQFPPSCFSDIHT